MGGGVEVGSERFMGLRWRSGRGRDKEEERRNFLRGQNYEDFFSKYRRFFQGGLKLANLTNLFFVYLKLNFIFVYHFFEFFSCFPPPSPGLLAFESIKRQKSFGLI